MGIYQELKTRHVFKVGIVYLVIGWALIQVADLVAPQMRLPEWTPRMITFVVMLGFPVALVMAWALELTPEGVKKASGNNLPIIIFALVLAGLSLFWYLDSDTQAPATAETAPIAEPAAGQPLAQEGPPSLAVLPFDNVSMDEANEPFTVGIHDDLLTQLSKIGALKVISRTSILRYKDTEKAIPEIAADLGVGHVVEGGVQRVGDNVRINVQLIAADSDEHLWADTYDREISAANIFAIQTEIATSIAHALQATLTQDDQHRLDSIPTDNLEALEAYFNGKRLADLRGAGHIEDAIREFERSVSLDPEFAMAYAGLGYAWLLLPEYSATADRKLTRDSSKAAISRALELDPDLSSAQAFMGWSKMVHEYDWVTAERYLRRALELQPHNSDALHWLSHVLSWQGFHEEAIATARKAVEVDPFSPLMNMNLAYILMDDRRFEETDYYRELTLQLQPDYTELWRNTWLTWMRAGRWEKATEALVNWAQGTGRDVELARRLGEMLELGNSTGEVARFPGELLASLALGTENLGQVYAAGGDAENALEQLRIALDERAGSRSVLSMKINPLYDFIRDDPRFIDLMREANLAP